MATDHHRNPDAERSSTTEQTHVFSPEKSATLAVIEAVASATGDDVTSLPALYEAINPDALDDLFESAATRPGTGPRVSFSYAGFAVDVDGGPAITVTLEESAE